MRSDVCFLLAMMAGVGWVVFVGTEATNALIMFYGGLVIVASGLTLWLDQGGKFSGRSVYATSYAEGVSRSSLLLFEQWMLRSQIGLVIGITMIFLWAKG